MSYSLIQQLQQLEGTDSAINTDDCILLITTESATHDFDEWEKQVKDITGHSPMPSNCVFDEWCLYI